MCYTTGHRGFKCLVLRVMFMGGKTCSGGGCDYINDAWCHDTVVVWRHCSLLVEFIIVKCWPFYILREFTVILVVAVYIPPSPNNNDRNEALTRHSVNCTMPSASNRQHTQTVSPSWIFQPCRPKVCVSKNTYVLIFQHRGGNILDLVYTTHRGAYTALPLPHLASPNTPLLCLFQHTDKGWKSPNQFTRRVWPEGASSALQDCFATTDWDDMLSLLHTVCM